MRAAINTPIQGSAADVATAAMLSIAACPELRALGWTMLLQVRSPPVGYACLGFRARPAGSCCCMCAMLPLRLQTWTTGMLVCLAQGQPLENVVHMHRQSAWHEFSSRPCSEVPGMCVSAIKEAQAVEAAHDTGYRLL